MIRTRIENLYDRLAKRLFITPQYAKRLVYMVGYGGGDPWERHLVGIEMDELVRELL